MPAGRTTLAAALVALLSGPILPQRAPSPPAARAAPRAEAPTPFAVGETLTYDVSWSTAFTAGAIVSTVKEKRPSYNSIAYYIVAEGRPTPLLSALYPVYYKMDTLVDVYTLLSQRGSLYSEEGVRHRLRATRFDREAKQATYEDQSATTARIEFPIPPGVQDGLSSLYALRALPLKAGARTAVAVSINGQTYQTRVDVAAPERIAVPFGEVSGWKLNVAIADPRKQAVGRPLAVWLSADAHRYPLKVQGELPFGSFVLSLRDAR